MKIFETAKGFEPLKDISQEVRSDNVEMHTMIQIHDQFDQTMLGFGGAFTESSAYNLLRVDKKVREAFIKAYFDPHEGIGYRLGRVSINSSDFGLTTYNYVSDYDHALTSFNLDRDQQIIDLILDCQKVSGEPIEIMASPWSPPFWMKDNQSAIKGGKLLKQYYQLWADYMVLYIKAMLQKGIHLKRITIQNEPLANQRWESCLYEHQDEKEMVVILGETIKKAQLPIELYIWDHNRDKMYERSTYILSDPIANQYVDGIAFHWYDNDQFMEVKKTHETFKDKILLFTEGCQEGGPHLYDYQVAERYGVNMMHDIHHGTVGYIDWNLFLDTTGGPNHVNNLCSSPVMVDVFPEKIIKNPSYYYIAHLSKFVKHQAKRLETISDSAILHNAFINPNGEFVLVLLNIKDDSIEVKWTLHEVEYKTQMRPHSMQTIIIK